MKIGKVSQTVLKRSMLKPIQLQNEKGIFAPSVEEMCFGVQCDTNEQILCTSVVLYGDEKDLGVFALAQAMNDLATRGAKMVGANVHIMLPPHAYESRLKAMMEAIARAGSAHAVQILNAKAEVSPVVQKAVVYLDGMGVFKEEELMQSAHALPKQDVVLLKWIGLSGTFRIMREKEEALKERFVPSFLKQVQNLETEIFSVSEIDMARAYGVSAMHQIGEGGILAALWELSESAGIGLEVDMKQMSIRQETVEICEYFHLNPYQLISTGSILIVAKRGEALVEAYREKGICATMLGKTTKDTARVIWGGEEKRFLDRPAPDELLKIFEKEM